MNRIDQGGDLAPLTHLVGKEVYPYMLSLYQTSRFLGVEESTVISWIESGTLEAVRLTSGDFRIPATVLAESFEANDEWINQLDEFMKNEPPQ